ncbi:MAG TPA: collagen-like protein [Candidatus Babeliales bacterium]|nr:collagen-like protein [Candidatus Babeliales bacterium]
MKKLAQLLLIVSCMSYAHDDIRLFEINRKKDCCVAPCNADFNFDCCPGPRGKRGHRGRKGATGATGPAGSAGGGELFLNALQMTHSLSEGPVPINEFFAYGIGSSGSPVAAWILDSPDSAPDFIGINFIAPSNLDNTAPVNVVLYFVVPNTSGASTGDSAQIFLQADYKSSGGLIGIEAPATGFVTTALSPVFTFTEPAASTPFDTNLTLVTTTISLDPSLITPGQWIFLQVSRNFSGADDYSFPIYLSDISFQFSQL